MKFKVMLFDELIFVFDFEFVGEVLNVMKELVREGMIMFVVIYEMGFVREVVNRVVFMDKGKIVEEGLFEEIFINLK